MDMIAFYGHIETDDSKGLSRLLGAWVETRELALKIGRLGVEFVYEDGPFYLYCSEAASGPGIAPSFLLEGHLAGTLEGAELRLRQLSQLCESASLSCRLEYVQVNAAGDEVSEQFSVK